jgi:hypothetical protein
MTDNKQNDETKKSAHLCMYLGEDVGYWSLLKEKFQTDFKKPSLEFEHVYKSTGTEIQTLITYVREKRPKIVFVDVSKHTSEMLHVVRILSRLNGVIKPPIIALADYTQGVGPFQRAVIAGVSCVHVKGAETDAVCYDAICFAFPDDLEDHGFATAKLGDDITAYVPSKVGVLSPDGVRIESNIPLNVGSSYNIQNYWLRKGMLKTPSMQCASATQEDLYYNFTFAQEFGFEFVDPVEAADKEPEVYNQLVAQRETEIQECRERMVDWVEKNQKYSKSKMLKTLIIDKEMLFYKDQPLTDEFNFVIRCQPYLVHVKKELLQIAPQLIVFHMEDVDPEELEANEDIAYTYNETRTLHYLIKVIKSIQDYSPFIIVFNSEGHNTEKLQKVLNYKQIMANSEKMTPELVHKMAGLLENKLKAGIQDYDVPTVFLEKDHPASYCEVELDIQIVACSENDIYFNCPIQLQSRSILRVNLPAPMYVSVATPPKSSRTASDYYGVIHGINEEERKDLRRFINSVFFREKEAAKAAEAQEVEKQKQAFQAKKQEEERKAQEAAKAAEEAKKKAEAEAKAAAEEAKKQAERAKVAEDD